jgi:hypothetical protein
LGFSSARIQCSGKANANYVTKRSVHAQRKWNFNNWMFGMSIRGGIAVIRDAVQLLISRPKIRNLRFVIRICSECRSFAVHETQQQE